MRTSLNQQIQSSLMFTNVASQKLMAAQNHAASGKRIMKPSDDVPGTNRALSLRSSINTVNQFADNVTVSKPLVDVTEGALGDMAQVIHRIRDLTIEAAKSDYTDDASTTQHVAELNGLMGQLVDIANTKFGDQYIFSGTATSTPPVQANPGPIPDPAVQPYIYAGNNGVRMVQVLSWVSLPVNIPGNRVLNFDTGGGNPAGAGSTDVFTMVKNLGDAISGGNVDQISAQLKNIDKNFDNVLGCQAQIGSWQSRMEGAQTTLSDTRDRLKQMLSDTEDIDLPTAIVELKSQENVYQTALMITARMLNLSLASINQ